MAERINLPRLVALWRLWANSTGPDGYEEACWLFKEIQEAIGIDAMNAEQPDDAKLLEEVRAKYRKIKADKEREVRNGTHRR
jgi:hypothetical protein